MKTYLTPLAIIIGSIIISISLYLAITSKERAQFNWCVDTHAKADPKDKKVRSEAKELCKTLQHLGKM
tara:strand:+ start:112 stop:315 length:204 start_codon:yes stop_codon:yes gene_type:complete